MLVRRLTPWLLPLVLVALWQAGVSSGRLPSVIFPTPKSVVATLWDLLTNGTLGHEMWYTLRRIIIGFALGTAAGVVLGAAVGSSRLLERMIDGTVQGLRAVPAIAWIPFFILWLGIDDKPKIAIVILATFFPVYLNTVSGVRSTDQKLIELARAYRLPRRLTLTRILLPAALPQLFVGLRLAAGISWVAATFAEILAGNHGLGVLLNDGRSLQRPDQTVALMIVLAVAGKSTDGLIVLLERRVTRWRSTLQEVAQVPAERRAVPARGVAWESE